MCFAKCLIFLTLPELLAEGRGVQEAGKPLFRSGMYLCRTAHPRGKQGRGTEGKGGGAEGKTGGKLGGVDFGEASS